MNKLYSTYCSKQASWMYMTILLLPLHFQKYILRNCIFQQASKLDIFSASNSTQASRIAHPSIYRFNSSNYLSIELDLHLPLQHNSFRSRATNSSPVSYH